MSGNRNVGNALRIDILTRDHYTCQYCGRRAPQVELHVEHVISVHDGGSNHPSNLVAACTDCNYGKGKRSLQLYMERPDPIFFLDFVPGPDPKAVPPPPSPPEPRVPLRQALLAEIRAANDSAFYREFCRPSLEDAGMSVCVYDEYADMEREFEDSNGA